MEYRRFGKSDKKLSVITLGGMRYKNAWNDPRDEVPEESLSQASTMVKLALDAGINHIETAWGYKKSEHIYGRVLNEELSIPRNDYYLMTKGAPATPKETRELVEKQLKHLQTDYFDFYGWHGMNNWEQYHIAMQKNGPVEELLKLKDEGVIKHVGFSTHAPVEIIIKALESDFFDFVNLHYYYFFQRNKGAIDLAQAKDMGVFIISPNDKGGRLFDAPASLRDLTLPATPIQWNARFCLQNPAVHTLSFGMTEPAHVEEMKGIFPVSVPLADSDREILQKLDQQLMNDPYATYEGYELANDPSGINIPEVLRMRRIWKCYGMEDFARYRYNMLQPDHHWFPGKFATKENTAKIDFSKVPAGIPLAEILYETHQGLHTPKK